ncbi:hypothetical protein GCM10010402_10120 [Actinomadura luteofluorescens]|uniref:DUF397 domain-containing protein n=1 Tax=Actinomadura luteofluorescens TaxID=46163 RepID=UPI002164B446|nr:DUF397 domain-containing protein [Actinomadura glauciflava]MCR3738558.1 protein of unknown function (DUF397) [Actinomadura glauciflava]
MNTPVPTRPIWRKSSYSGGHEGDCVEVADLNGRIGIRDSKNLTAGHLTLTREAFTTLLTHLTSRP